MNATTIQNDLQSLKTYRNLIALELHRAPQSKYIGQWGTDRRRELDSVDAQIERIQWQLLIS